MEPKTAPGGMPFLPFFPLPPPLSFDPFPQRSLSQAPPKKDPPVHRDGTKPGRLTSRPFPPPPFASLGASSELRQANWDEFRYTDSDSDSSDNAQMAAMALTSMKKEGSLMPVKTEQKEPEEAKEEPEKKVKKKRGRPPGKGKKVPKEAKPKKKNRPPSPALRVRQYIPFEWGIQLRRETKMRRDEVQRLTEYARDLIEKEGYESDDSEVERSTEDEELRCRREEIHIHWDSRKQEYQVISPLKKGSSDVFSFPPTSKARENPKTRGPLFPTLYRMDLCLCGTVLQQWISKASRKRSRAPSNGAKPTSKSSRQPSLPPHLVARWTRLRQSHSTPPSLTSASLPKQFLPPAPLPRSLPRAPNSWNWCHSFRIRPRLS